MRMRNRIGLGVAAAMLASLPAFAHPGHGEGTFVSGVVHPVGGIDHLAAMLAVGLWAGLVGGARRWVWPLSFVAAMIAGAAAAWSGVPLPGAEAVIAASVLALGVAIAVGWSPAVALGSVMIAAFGFAHGVAHATDMPGGALLSSYAAGFVAGTAALHMAGLGAAGWLGGLGARQAPRLIGGAFAALGLVLVVGTLAP